MRAFLFLVTALVCLDLGAQTALTPLMECGGVKNVLDQQGFRPRGFGIDDHGFCSEFTFSAGWDKKLYLYIGDGASPYAQLILQAADVWNKALSGSMIELVADPAVQLKPLSRTIWDSGETISRQNLGDGYSVIYFKPSSRNAPSGFTVVERNGSGITEADIYINTFHEARYGNDLAVTHLILDVDDDCGIYSFVQSTFGIILHELGHALGLDHIPIAGNVMSYDYGPWLVSKWESPMGMFVLNQLAIHGSEISQDPTRIPFVFRHDDVFPLMKIDGEAMLESLKFFTGSARLGEQDRTALMCVYDF